MKTFLRMFMATALLFSGTHLFAQTQAMENFNSTGVGNIPAGWTVAANTDVATYKRPGTCNLQVSDKGLLTPGVGKNAPMGMVLPATAFNANYNDIVINFSVYVFDANLKCSSVKPFPCATFVRAYIVPTTWNDPLGTPKAKDYYAAQPNYQILYPNANNTIVFKDITLPAGAGYRVLLNFKTADGSNCPSNGTKFIFDDMGVESDNCTNCAPHANADYFNADAQELFAKGTSFNANLYGGYSKWASEAPAGFEIASLTTTPAVNFGADYDLNNTSLSDATFALTSPLVIEKSSNCTTAPNPGTLTFHSNGTFTYAKGSACVSRVSFTYSLTTYKPGRSNAYGTTLPTNVTIDLPGQQMVLPVRFKSFTATRSGKQVSLKWVTASEQNNKGFYLQRNTGNEWKDIALLFSKQEDGNSSSEIAYAYTDLNPVKGITQYRILQVDFDGTGHYSDLRAVQGEASAAKLTLFPNPSSTGNVTLLFESAGIRELTVSDLSGRNVQQHKNISAGSFELKGLQPGFYTVHITERSTNATTVEKIIIKKR